MTGPYCGVCKEKVPEDEHYRIEVSYYGPDKPDKDTYVLHRDCKESVVSGWMDP